MDTAIMSSKGQVVIPSRLRRKLGITPGTRLVFDEKDGHLELRPVTGAYVDSIKGMLKARPGAAPVTRELLADHAAEVAAEEAALEKRGL